MMFAAILFCVKIYVTVLCSGTYSTDYYSSALQFAADRRTCENRGAKGVIF